MDVSWVYLLATRPFTYEVENTNLQLHICVTPNKSNKQPNNQQRTSHDVTINVNFILLENAVKFHEKT